MSYKSIDTKRFHWSWKQFGTGPRLLLAFHGFNRSPEDFHPFEKWLGDEYTILSFDLFFHGKSYVKSENENYAFSREELREVLLLILDQYQKKEFEVMAYSFGGRIALNCIEIMGVQVKAMYLMAPDAMRFNPGYWFAAQTIAGKFTTRFFHRNPELVFLIMRMLAKIGIYKAKVMDFYLNQISYKPVREKVFKVWDAHSKTVPSRKKVAKIIKEKKIPVLLFFGKYDQIIPSKLGVRFAKACGSNAELFILDIGHRLPEKHEEICSKMRMDNGH